MIPSLLKLIARIEDTASADVSLKDVRVLAKSHDPEVIDTLAGLLDDEGRVGREAAAALTRFGRTAEATLRRCLASGNDTVVERATALLSALGDAPAADLPALPSPEPTNDNEERVACDVSLLASPEVTRAIGATLYARGVPVQDIDDGIAEVQTRVLELLRLGPAPRELAEWRALGNTVAANFVSDTERKRKSRSKYDEGLCEEPDAHLAVPYEQAWEPIDAQRMVEVCLSMLEAGDVPPESAEILVGRMDDLTDAEIGEELGLSGDVVYKRRHTLRGHFGWALAGKGLAELIPRSREKKRAGWALQEGSAARPRRRPAK